MEPTASADHSSPTASPPISRTHVIAMAVAVMAVVLAGWWIVVPHRARAGDSTSLAALLPRMVDGRPFEVMPMPPDDLEANVDMAHLAALRTIAERHGRTLADVQLATALGTPGNSRTIIFAVRVHGVPATELLPLQWLQPDPSYPPIARPRPAVMAGHPVLIVAPEDDERPVLMLRGEILFTFIAPDDATVEAMIRSAWDASEPAALTAG
jgi:hypothetical protein